MLINRGDRKFMVTGEFAECFVSDPRFEVFINSIDPSIEIRSIEVLGITKPEKGPLLAFHLDIDAWDTIHNRKIYPSLVILRGEAVAVTILYITPDGKKHIVLVKQPRLPLGQLDSIEIVAGIRDKSCSIEELAVKEAYEETKITLDQEVTYVTSFSGSPGLVSEMTHLFRVEIPITYDSLDALIQDKTEMGLHEAEGEFTQRIIVPLSDALELVRQDAKSVVAVLYELLPRN